MQLKSNIVLETELQQESQVFNFNTENTDSAVLPMKFATELLQMWFQQLHYVEDKFVIGQLQDSLRGCTVQQAMIITQSWLNQQKLIKAIDTNDYSSYLVK